MENDLQKEKAKLNKVEDQFAKELDSLKEKQGDELTRVENGHRDTLEMLNVEKDKIIGTL